MLPPSAGKYMMISGLAMVTLTFLGTARYVSPFYTHTYPFAWYGLILFLDGLLWWRWNEGLVLGRPREFITLLFWSAVFWFFFELWNLRLQNWYYAGVPPKGLWAHVEAYLDFATVLPGMFLVYRLLHCMGVPRPLKTRFALGKETRKIWTFIGLFMLVLPLVWPDWFFPLVWGALIFLLEPVCAKQGGPSLLKDAENGEWTTFVRLLLAGLLCGGYWELCNYRSLEKWVYTVPLFSEGKLFEMPYLGFLGFPPFGVECFVMTNAVYLLRGGRHWNPDFLGPNKRQHARKVLYVLLIVLGICLSEFSFSKMEQHTIDSRSESLEQILGDISAEDTARLNERGYRFPEEILKDWEKAKQVIRVSFRDTIRDRLEMASLLNIGSTNARLLEAAGIRSREKLGREDPDRLFGRLVTANQTMKLRQSPLLRRRIVAWISSAKRKSAVY
jgi:hypothetical protein